MSSIVWLVPAEFRDDDTGQHIIRVGRYARIIAEELGFSPVDLDIIEPAAQLHDVGKIGISRRGFAEAWQAHS